MFPSEENPTNRYKFNSIDIYFNQDKKVITRTTYTLFDFMSEVGGFVFILYVLGGLILAPVTRYNLRMKLLTSSVFRHL